MPRSAVPPEPTFAQGEGAAFSGVSIEPVARALRVLTALNRRSLSTLAQVHADTGLPKPTLVRLLQTLIAEGYVEQVSRGDGYRLRRKVLELSAGYRPRNLLIEVAQAPMDRFTAIHKWPLYLGTVEDRTMWVRYTTATTSPVSPDYQSPYHYRFSLLVSALGRAYLAHCPRGERQRLLEPLLGLPDLADGQVRDARAVEVLLAAVKHCGYATTGSIDGDRGRGLAVPLRAGRQVIGAISLRHYRSTLSETDAVKRYLEPLQELSTEIGTAFQRARRAAQQSH